MKIVKRTFERLTTAFRKFWFQSPGGANICRGHEQAVECIFTTTCPLHVEGMSPKEPALFMVSGLVKLPVLLLYRNPADRDDVIVECNL